MSLPAEGEWIEMIMLRQNKQHKMSIPAEGEWIEMIVEGIIQWFAQSLPAEGEWIEIYVIAGHGAGDSVSPCRGRVD